MMTTTTSTTHTDDAKVWYNITSANLRFSRAKNQIQIGLYLKTFTDSNWFEFKNIHRSCSPSLLNFVVVMQVFSLKLYPPRAVYYTASRSLHVCKYNPWNV